MRQYQVRMARKNKKSVNPAPAPVQEQPVVRAGEVFIQYTREANLLLNELTQRRAFDNDIGMYLREKNLVDDFNAWRSARQPVPSKS